MRITVKDLDAEIARVNAIIALPEVQVEHSGAYGRHYIVQACGSGEWGLGGGGSTSHCMTILRDRDLPYECFRRGCNHHMVKYGVLKLRSGHTLKSDKAFIVTLTGKGIKVTGHAEDIFRLAFWYMSKPE